MTTVPIFRGISRLVVMEDIEHLIFEEFDGIDTDYESHVKEIFDNYLKEGNNIQVMTSTDRCFIYILQIVYFLIMSYIMGMCA